MAAAAKHTPGPWTHYDDSEDGKTNRHEIAAIGKTVARIYCTNGMEAEDCANARLIAAAPDLLAALRALLQQTGNIEVLGEWEALDMNYTSRKRVRAQVDQVIADARAAIASATGAA